MRNIYGKFSYDSFSAVNKDNSLVLTYHYTIENLSSFTHQVILENPQLNEIDQTVNYLAFTIGISEALNYWKLTASNVVDISAGMLTKDQISFWEWVFTHGMSEFHYKNNLDFTKNNFVSITTSHNPLPNIKSNKLLNGELILSGGGKDSSVTLELLKNSSANQIAFVLETNSTIESAKSIALVNDYQVFSGKRILDPKLFTFNKDNFYNGHVPFSLVLALISVLSAYIFDLQYVVASNESSANEPTLLWNGAEINHQIAKSLTMENMIRNYLSNQSSNLPEYFSFLRPLSEIQIALIFTSLSQYHHIAKSCNVGQKNNIWCCQCSKCAFSYALFFPFLNYDKIIEIFGSDLFANDNIVKHLRDNAGLTDKKPFECVGTIEETIHALLLCKEQYLIQKISIPDIAQSLFFEIEQKSSISPEKIEGLLKNSWVNQNNLPTIYQEILKNKLKNL